MENVFNKGHSGLFTLLFIVTLNSCQKNTGEVKLTLENKGIYFLDSISQNHWLQYEDELERSLAQNIITYSLSNTTNKKLLFVFDQLALEPCIGISTTTNHYGYMGFIITDKSGKIKMPYATMVTPSEIADLVECDLHELEKKRNTYSTLEVKESGVPDFDNYLHNAVLINPSETRMFKAILYLPIIWERDERTNSSNMSYRDLTGGDELKLLYYCKAADFKKSLPQYIKDDLVKNNIEVFDGILEANAIRLKKK